RKGLPPLERPALRSMPATPCATKFAGSTIRCGPSRPVVSFWRRFSPLPVSAVIVAVSHIRAEEDVMLKSKLVVVSCVAIVTGLLAARAASGNIPHTNYLTFSAPFALPGVSLPAGTYVFDVLATDSNNVVRVTSRDGSRTYLTAFTVTVQRPKGLPGTQQ